MAAYCTGHPIAAFDGLAHGMYGGKGLSLRCGDEVTYLHPSTETKHPAFWTYGLRNYGSTGGRKGWFPSAFVQPLMYARVVDVDLPIQVFSRSHQKLRDGRIVKLFSAEHMRVEYWFGQQRFVKTMHTQSKDWIFL